MHNKLIALLIKANLAKKTNTGFNKDRLPTSVHTLVVATTGPTQQKEAVRRKSAAGRKSTLPEECWHSVWAMMGIGLATSQ